MGIPFPTTYYITIKNFSLSIARKKVENILGTEQFMDEVMTFQEIVTTK